MSVRIVIDMNLSVEWVTVLAGHGWSAVHWSTVGDPRAEDATIVAWALANGYVVFTHDLDFGPAPAARECEPAFASPALPDKEALSLPPPRLPPFSDSHRFLIIFGRFSLLCQ